MTVEVVAREKVNGVECYKVVRQAGEDKSDEHLVVRYDGVYRTAEGGKPLAVPYRVLALPPTAAKVWQDGGNKLGLLRASSVQTPAGKYDKAWLVQEEKDGTEELVRRSWYADGVGPVKVETPRVKKKGAAVSELRLKAYQPPR